MENTDWIDHDAVALWGPSPGEYGERGRGRVIAVMSEPSLIIEAANGYQFHWAASLCRRVATWENVQDLREALLLETDDGPTS